MMMTFATELVRFHDQAAADDETAKPAKIKGLRANTEALRETMLDKIEPDWKVEEAFGKLQDAAALYSRTAPSNPAQRETRFAAFNAALAAFAAALDGAEADRSQPAGQAFCADQVPNPLADLL
ncbi:hypothetical protein D3273_13615 [Lichenibacterium minor]|uniref:Uncharacterized protein n=1 Tax=Lichenibacterium minor TaxID=2316528 RepID=A0A4Q2U6D1_9HYPH|nr:hypothetical protein [Lichenibacterium minor]RYC31418.1 hypothetical protein D3273_13615 [Lichenibacterium minor]